MSIRPLVEADIPPLAAMLGAQPLMRRYLRTAPALERALAAARARGDGLLVLDEGPGPEGLAWFHPTGTFGLGGYLRLIAVAPEISGRGAGARLLAAFEDALAPRVRHAFLLVSDFNVAAQRFYERHGYQRVGAIPALVLPDVTEFLYWKRLPTL